MEILDNSILIHYLAKLFIDPNKPSSGFKIIQFNVMLRFKKLDWYIFNHN